MNDVHCEHSTDAAAYVLGALDADSGFEHHLANCEICQADVDLLREGAKVLPRSTPPVAAPRELIDSVMATVRAEADVLNAAGAAADKPAARERRFGLRSLALGTALAVVLALVAVVAIPGGSGPEQTTRGEMLAKTMPSNASVTLYEGDGKAHLKVAGIPKAGESRIYEVWLQRPDDSFAPTDALFDVTADGNGTVYVPDLADAKAIYITNEPAGGSEQPTTNPLMRVELTS